MGPSKAGDPERIHPLAARHNHNSGTLLTANLATRDSAIAAALRAPATRVLTTLCDRWPPKASSRALPARLGGREFGSQGPQVGQQHSRRKVPQRGMTERFWAQRGLYKYAGHARPCAVDARDARNTDKAIERPINTRRAADMAHNWEPT